MGTALGAGTAFANPLGGQVVSGNITMSVPDPSTLAIQQTTNKGIIDWQSFNIATGEKTVFQQPSSSATTLNRVNVGNPSTIAGQLSANGNLILVNPSGVFFSKGSQVNANSLLVTPANIRNENFLAGKMIFDQPGDPNASVVNAGTITVAQKGLAALVAPSVANSGVIRARLGKVVLGGANTYAIDFYGDGLLSFDVGPNVSAVPLGPDGKPVGSLVSNTGRISAAGGTVLLTADAVAGILDNVIDGGGSISARTATTPAGTVSIGNINIDAGPGNGALVRGTLDVSGLRPGQTGGNVAVTGNSVTLTETAKIDARGHSGGGTVKIGGGAHGQDPTIRNAQTTTIAAGATIDASALDNGAGGTVAVWSNGSTVFNGTIYANGGANGGNGGWVETSGEGTLNVGSTALVLAAAPHGQPGTWLLDPADSNVTIGTTTTGNNCTVASTTCSPTADDSTINAATINTALKNGVSVTVTTENDATGSQVGDIIVNQSLFIDAGSTQPVTLTLLAGAGGGNGGITISAPITDTGSPNKLSLILTAGGAIAFDSAVTIQGDLTATAGTHILADITQTAAITVGGNSSFSNSSTGGSISLDGASNALGSGTGTIAFTTQGTNGNVSVTNSGGTNLTTSTVAGTLTVEDTTGAISQSGALTVSGTSSFTTQGAGQKIDLSNAGNMLTGTVTLATDNSTGADASLTNSVDTTLANAVIGGKLTVAAGGNNLILNGVTTSNDTLDLTGSTGTITLNAGTYAINTTIPTTYTFPAVTTGAGMLTLGQATNFGAITLNGDTTFDSSTAGAALDFQGAIDGAFALTTNSGSALTTFGAAVGTGANLTRFSATAGSFSLGGDITSTGAVSLTSTGMGPLSLTKNISGTTVTLSSGGTISQTGGTITATSLTGGSVGGTSLTQANAISGLGDFADTGATSTGISITDNHALPVSGAVSSVAGPIALTVTGAGNALTISGSLNATGGAGNVTLSTGTGGIGLSGTGSISGGVVDLSTTGGVTEVSSASIIATTLQSSSDVVGAVSLLGTANAISSLGTFTVSGAGNGFTLSDAVANLTQSGALTVSGASSFTNTQTGGKLTLTQANVLTGTVTLATTGAGADASLTNTLDTTLAAPGNIGGGLTIAANTNAITLNGVNLGGTLSLTTTGTVTLDAGTYTINGGTTPYTFSTAVTTGAGTLTFKQATIFSGAVTLGGDTIFDTSTSTVSKDITFGSTLNGATAHAATVTAGGGTATFDGAVGSAVGSNVTTFSVTAGTITLGGTVTTTGAQTYTDTTALNLNAASYTTTTNGAFTVNGPTSIGAASVTIDTSAGPATIALNGQTSVGANNLTLNSGSAGQTLDGVTVTTGTFIQNTSGTTTLGAGTYTLNNTGSQTFGAVSIDAPGATGIVLGQNTTFGAMTLTGANVTSAITSSGKTITFGTIQSTDGTQGLTIDTGTGQVTFGGVIGGGGNVLKTLTVTDPEIDANVTTSGDQDYKSAVTIGGGVVLTSTGGNVQFEKTLDDAQAAGTDTLEVSVGGSAIFGGVVGGAMALKSLTVDGTGTTQLNTLAVTTTGAQDYKNAVTLGAAGTTVVTTGGSPVSFESTVDAAMAGQESLQVVAGTTGAVGFTGAVGTVALGSLTVTSSSTTTLSGNVTTTGAQSYTTTTGLTLAGSTYETNAPTGAGTGATFSVTGITTLGAAAITVDTTGGGASAAGAGITFSDEIEDAAAGNTALTLKAGTGGQISLQGTVGATNPLASLTATGASTALSGNVSTDGFQQYNSGVTLSGDVVLNSNANGMSNGAITLGQVTGGTHNLTLTSGTGAQTLAGIIAGSLTETDSTGAVILTDGTYTIGAGSQDFSAIFANQTVSVNAPAGGVVLGLPTTFGAFKLAGADSTIDSSGVDGDITFAGTIDATNTGTQGLIVKAGNGTVTFQDVVGGTPLSSLTVDSAATVDADVTTKNDQLYTQAVILGGTAGNTIVLTTTNDGNVTFDKTVDATTAGDQALTVAAGAGTVTFAGAVGGAAGVTALNALTVTGGIIKSTNTTGSIGVATTGVQTYTALTELDLQGGETYATNFAGTGSGTGTFTVNGTGGTVLKGSGTVTIDTTGSGATTAGADITFSGAGTIDDGSGAGTVGLKLQSGTSAGTGSISIGGAVGGTQALASLTALTTDATPVSTNGTITLSDNVITAGLQSYTDSTLNLNGATYRTNVLPSTDPNTAATFTQTGATVLGTTATIDTTGNGNVATGANITFTNGTGIGTIDGAAADMQSVTLNAGTGGQITLGGAVGATGGELQTFSATGGSFDLATTGQILTQQSSGGTLALTSLGTASLLDLSAVKLVGETVELSSADGISQTAGSTTDIINATGTTTGTGLSVISSGTTGSVSLTADNTVSQLAFQVAGAGNDFVFTDAATALTITAVSKAVSGSIVGGTTGFGGGTGGGKIQLATVGSGDITIGTGSNTAEGLTSNGGEIDIAAAAGSGIANQIATISSANGNIVLLGDSISLGGGNGTGAVNAGTGTVVLGPSSTGDSIQLGTVSGAGVLGLQSQDFSTITANMVQVGYRNTDGSPSFSGGISIVNPVSIDANQIAALSLVTGAGGITQTAPLTFTNITAGLGGTGKLGILSGGTVTLLNGGNTVNILAAYVDGSGSTFAFKNSTGLFVDALGNTQLELGVVPPSMTTGQVSLATMTGLNGVNPLSGIRTNGAGGQVLVETAAGDLTLDQNVCAGLLTCTGTSTATVGLKAAGNLNQTAGFIGAGSLVANAVQSVTLDGDNAVDVLAGNAGGNYLFTDNNNVNSTFGLEVGAVTSGLDGTVSATGVSTSGGDIRLTNKANNLTLLNNVNAGGGANNVALVNAGGNITETTGAVVANGLIADTSAAGAAVTLNNGNNSVAVLAGQTSGGDFAFTDARSGGLTVGTAPAVAGGVGSQSGIVTNGGNISVTSSPASVALTLAANLTSGGQTVTLTSGGGISQTAGIVTAGTLTGSAVGATTLTQGNLISNLAAFSSTAGTFSFVDAQPLNIIGTLSAGGQTVSLSVSGDLAESGNGAITAATLTGTVSGATALGGANAVDALGAFSAGGAFGLNDGVALGIAGDLNAAGQIVTLTDTSTGGISEAGGTITAATLTGSSSGIADFTGANNIATLADFASAGNFSLSDAVALSLQGNQTAAGATIALASAGQINQQSGAVTAATLVLSGAGGLVFGGQNQVANLGGATNGGAGGVLFTDASALNVTGAVTGGGGVVDLVVGGALSTSAAISAGTNGLFKAQSISLGAAVNTGSTTVLVATNGGVSEAAGGTITAPSLIVQATGPVALDNSNAVNALAGTGTGTFAFASASSLTIGSIAGGSVTFPAGNTVSYGSQAGLTTSGPTRIRANSGDILLASNVIGAGDVALVSASGNVNEANGAAVTAPGLIIDGAGSATFASANNVGTLAGKLAGGSLTFINGPNLTVGTVPGPLDVATQSGFFAGLNVTLQSLGGSITIQGDITADPGGNLLVTSAGSTNVNGNVTLNATNNIILASGGPFNQSGTLRIVGPDLVIDTTGKSLASSLAPLGGGPYTSASQIDLLGQLASGGNGGAINIGGVLSANGAVVLLSANTGVITGNNVSFGQLGVSGLGGSATLTGCLGSNCSTTAAEQGFIFPIKDNNYRFNTCAIGSVSCLVLPALTPIQPNPITNFAVLVAKPVEDDVDAPLTNIFDENRLCDQLYRTAPEMARMVCQ